MNNNFRFGQASNNILALFKAHIDALSYYDCKWVSFRYENGKLKLEYEGKILAEVQAKIFPFIPNVQSVIYTVSPGAMYTNIYIMYGLEDEVKAYRADLMKRLEM